jgi:isoquinoline 1-oxidoreductase
MNTTAQANEVSPAQDCQLELGRRTFMQILGAGLLVTVAGETAPGQRRRRRGGSQTVAARLHIARTGKITVMTGKVEVGQGSRAQITQAAAEELRVSVDSITLIMADTSLVPNDGITAGSRTTPSTVPAVRKAAATARGLLVDLASKKWKIKPADAVVLDGVITHTASKRKVTYAQLAASDDLAKEFQKAVPGNVTVTPVDQWKVLGTSVPRPNRRDIVTGAHRYPSDILREGMLYGKVLRPPSYGARLTAIDLSLAKAIKGVTVVRDGEFVGCAAATLHLVRQGLAALARGAKWKTASHPPSSKLFAHLKEHARAGGSKDSVKEALAKAKKTLSRTYEVAYIQHAPMEPRAAVAQWKDKKLTVWTGSQAPNRVASDLSRAFGLSSKSVRVIVPDTGGGFGGKHSADAAVEAARLARAAGKPVSLRWTRKEEFTWAYFRPAALIEIKGGLDARGALVAWDFASINPGRSGVACPYDVPNLSAKSVRSSPPLRQGSYRCLATTANNFARECFMDELAAAADADPLAFRLARLKDPRLRAVLEEAAKRFDWKRRKADRRANVGVGLACGTDKGSFVAACAEVAVDRKTGAIDVRRICEVFECGAVQNPVNLLKQVQGGIIMGLGPALAEEIRFQGGKIITDSFGNYPVPRFKDVPPLDIHQLNRRDLPSVGGGETPIIVPAPAIANAVFDATGIAVRSMPIRREALRKA